MYVKGVSVMVLAVVLAAVLAGMVWGAVALGEGVQLIPVNGLLEHGEVW